MTDIRARLQATIDDALAPDGVYSYWQRKAETAGEDADEYVVHTLDDNASEAFADDVPLVRSTSFAVRYYYRDSLLNTSAGRTRIKDREKQIASALISAGYTLPNGYFDAGDIDNVGFGTTIFPVEFWRVV